MLLIPFCVTAQSPPLSTIEGKVTDLQTGAGIPGINAYLSNTTIGTTTDSSGRYKLRTSAIGDYNLVFSFVGYNRKVFSIQLKTGTTINHNVQLEQQIIEMEEIEVISSNKEWKRNYDLFTKEFLGYSEFVEATTIQNPWVLSFEEGENNTLIATAKEPIIIENRALGYKLHLELVEFAWNRSGRGGVYQVYPRFEELETESDLQKQAWRINRSKTYFGSLPHFLRSLYQNRVQEEQFDVSQMGNIQAMTRGETKFELLGRPRVSSRKREELRGFKLSRKTTISFDHNVNLVFGSKSFEVSIRKKAEIAPNTEKEMFFVDQKGNLLNPVSIKLYGEWAKNRVANSLPYDYSPDEK